MPAAPQLPQHIAIIMDGNGRWAEERGLKRFEGHKEGAKNVRRIVEACVKRGVRYLTLYSFSTENWNRSTEEVTSLMELFQLYLDSERSLLKDNRIRLRAVGDLSRLPWAVRTRLERNLAETKENSTLDLILAVSYGAREELLNATRRIIKRVQVGELAEDFSAEDFSAELWTAGIPDPELLIRTSGEMRVSNFLLWQIAYAELVVVPEYWPDFSEAVLDRTLEEYAQRERRFGQTSEQIRSAKLKAEGK
ncbi:di-trans,poly-cis-decaprenylcistransferase [bacterium]|nr:di-trans,poly-cis-decaprenylcistransferase [bacterium]